MAVLYLIGEPCKVRKIGGRILIEKDKKTYRSFPFAYVDHIVANERAVLLPSVIFTCMQEKIPILYVSRTGQIAGRIADGAGSLQKLLFQHAYFTDIRMQLVLAQCIIKSKIENQRALLRQYKKSKEAENLERIIRMLTIFLKKIPQMHAISELRGLEGLASRNYFSSIPWIVAGREWHWTGRNRRPPRDPINALLSYGYALLEKEVRLAIAGTDLDERLGFIHSNNGRKDSLVFDLMELFRQPVMDRFVFKTLNLNIVSATDFFMEGQACRIAQKAKHHWLAYYEKYMQTPSKAYHDNTPRQWIRKQVQDFSRQVFSTMKQRSEEYDEEE